MQLAKVFSPRQENPYFSWQKLGELWIKAKRGRPKRMIENKLLVPINYIGEMK